MQGNTKYKRKYTIYMKIQDIQKYKLQEKNTIYTKNTKCTKNTKYTRKYRI